MKKIQITLFLLIITFVKAQTQIAINQEFIVRIETKLASDDMQGREIFRPGIDSASAFIENEFRNIGLKHFDNYSSFRQEFLVGKKPANNIIGFLEGKTLPNEYIIFSAHFDHLGTKNHGQDTVYNGANDDASGTTAVIALAKYFKETNQNQRSIIFVAFTGEETGGYGSSYFSENIDPIKVIAMFNIEMIGTQSKWGKNSAYITGFEMSDFGPILQKNLTHSDFNFHPDPYPSEDLFYRSDNARLAALGVPAHTISTSKMDIEPHYHQLSDDISTIDFENMTQIIKAIAISATTIINGDDTPTRVGR